MRPRSLFAIVTGGIVLGACGGGGGGGGADAPDSRSIAAGASETASLTDTDPRMRGNRGPYHVWTLRGRRGQRLVIDLTSSTFDTYLYLRDETGLLLGRDDDGGDGNNARIRTILPEDGRYRIIATSYGQTASGEYTLALGEWPAPEAPAAGAAHALEVGGTLDGLLEPGDEFSGDGPYQDRWTLELTEGQRVRIEMRSTDVDAYLILMDPDGRTLATNDDATGTDAALATRAAAAGRYIVLATTFGDHPQVGAYRIQITEVSGDAPIPGQVQTISEGQSLGGQLEAGDSTGMTGGYVDIYQFTPARAGQVTIELASTDLDVVLTVQDASGLQVGRDDDGGGGTNSRLNLPVMAGVTYRVLAGLFGSGRSGTYRLTVGTVGAAAVGK